MNTNPNDYGYLGNEKITISAEEYMLFKIALEQGLSLTQNISYPSKYKEEDGKKYFDNESTFTNENIVTEYDGKKLTKEMLVAQSLLVEIHLRNIEEGIAKSKEQLEDAKNLKVEEVAKNS